MYIQHLLILDYEDIIELSSSVKDLSIIEAPILIPGDDGLVLGDNVLMNRDPLNLTTTIVSVLFLLGHSKFVYPVSLMARFNVLDNTSVFQNSVPIKKEVQILKDANSLVI